MDSLFTTVTYGAGAAILATPTTTSVKGIKTIDGEGEGSVLDIDTFKSTTALAASTTTTLAPTYQDWSYQQTLNSVRNEAAIVECLSDEELASAVAMIEGKEFELSQMFEEEASSLGEYENSKKPYTK